MDSPSFEMAFNFMIAEWKIYAAVYDKEVTDHYTQLGSASVPAGYKLLTESLNTSIEVLTEKFKSLAEIHSECTIGNGDDESIHSLMSFCVNEFRAHVIRELNRRPDPSQLDPEPDFSEVTDTMEPTEWDPEPGFSELIDTTEKIKKIALDVMDGLSDRMTLRAQYGDTEPSSEAPEEKVCNFIFERECAKVIHMLELSTYAYKCFLSLSRRWHQPIEYSHYDFERSLITTTNILKNRVGHLSLAYGWGFRIGDDESEHSMRFDVYRMAEDVYYEFCDLHYDDLGPRPACDFDDLIDLVKTIEADAVAVLAKLEQTIVSTRSNLVVPIIDI
jgi:hypothetical protein